MPELLDPPETLEGEALTNAENGIEPAPESLAERMVRVAGELLVRGVARSHVKRILETYDLDRVERQIAWLPYRRAKSRASLLVAAIDNDYEQPATLEE